MSENISFSEKQQFRQKWIFAILFTALALMMILSVYAFVSHQEDAWILPLTTLPLILLILLFKQAALYLSINEDHLSYRFSPFQWKAKTISKEQVNTISVIRYNPLGEYGGWGIRMGTKGQAYTISGEEGISIEISGNKRLLIGTAHSKQVKLFLHEKWADKYVTA